MAHVAASTSHEPTPMTSGDDRGRLGMVGSYAYLPTGCGIPVVSASACVAFAGTRELFVAHSSRNRPKARGTGTVSTAAKPHRAEQLQTELA